MNFMGNSYGPMVPLPCFQRNSNAPMALKIRQKVPPRLALAHGWLFPVLAQKLSEPPFWRRQKGATPFGSNFFPRFLAICSSPAPLCVPCFLEYPVLICSDLLRFLLICFQNTSEKSLLPIPSQRARGLNKFDRCLRD